MRMDKINIVKILKDKPKGTRLYSPIIGECMLVNVKTTTILVRDHNGEDYYFNEYGAFLNTDGECMLFPSKKMKDWKRFSWKIGDILSYKENNFCIFIAWANDDYTKFRYKFNNVAFDNSTYTTLRWIKITNKNVIKEYFSNIEKSRGGKLNLEILEIEKQSEFKDGDIVQIDDDKFIIFKRIEPHKIHYYYLYRNGDIAINGYLNRDKCTLKLASEADKLVILSRLKDEKKMWNPNTKKIENLPEQLKLKPFDKVLVRNSIYEKWRAQIFSNCIFDNNVYFKYICINGIYSQCIPYNEKTAHLLGTEDNYEE